MVYIMFSLSHFHGWSLVEESFHCILYIYLCNLRKRKARVLQTSLWILVDCCVDGVFSTCSCKFCLCIPHLSFASNWTDEVVKFEFML